MSESVRLLVYSIKLKGIDLKRNVPGFTWRISLAPDRVFIYGSVCFKRLSKSPNFVFWNVIYNVKLTFLFTEMVRI